MAGLVAAVTGWPAMAAAQTPLAAVPDAAIVGKGRLQVLAMPILDVTLYSPHGAYTENSPLALRVDYLTHLSGKGMARHAVDEMRVGGLATEGRLGEWKARLESLLPDVNKGDTLFAVRSSSRATVFYRGAEFIGQVDDSAFTTALFAICLGPRTSQQSLRRQLLSLG